MTKTATPIEQIVRKVAKLASPPPKLSLSEWADSFRYLSSESSAEPGKWKTIRAPYQFGILDAISNHQVERIVLMCASQVGKTEMINNVVGYYVHQEPSPILTVQPTLEMAEKWSKERLKPMIRDTPVLRERINIDKRKDDTLLHKRFNGGYVTICGANSPSSLASMPIRILLMDEVDRYPLSAGKEGNPVDLAEKRTTTFHNRKIVMISSPAIKGESRIESSYENSDKRKFHVPCPQCGHFQTLRWEQVQWHEDDPKNAVYICEKNGCIIHSADKTHMLRGGKWIAENEFAGIAGFHLNELYSPWSSFGKMAEAFLKAKNNKEDLKVFVNTALAETWEDQMEGEAMDESELIENVEKYEGAPQGVLFITAGVDVQDDRFEIEVVGWGIDEESWSIDYHVIHGSPANIEVRQELDDYLEGYIYHQSGFKMKISCTGIDIGGHHAEEVYLYCKTKHRSGRRFYPVKGASQYGRSVITKPSKNNSYRVKMFTVGTDTAKDTIFAYLKLKEPGAGYCHFPAFYENSYFEMLTAEKKIKKYEKGRPIRKYVKKTASIRNEALDCRVYAYAALKIVKPNFQKIQLRFAEQIKRKQNQQPEPDKPKKQKRKAQGFTNNWKRE